MKLKHKALFLAPWKKGYNKPRQGIKKQRHYFPDKGPYNQGYGFSSSHVGRCESWIIKKAKHQELMLSNCGAGEDS